MSVSKRQAEKMWSELKGHFVNAEKVIIQIIQAKAWEPLGYGSFAEAWAERMAGARLASEELRAHVVYAMFDEGMDEPEVNEALGVGSGVGPHQVKMLRRQKSNGVPAGMASTRVRSHLRKKPDAPRTIHVTLSSDEYNRFKELAADRGLSVEKIATEAIRAAFLELA